MYFIYLISCGQYIYSFKKFRLVFKTAFNLERNSTYYFAFLFLYSVPGGKVNILGGHSKQKKKSMYVCPIPSGFRERAISVYSSLDLVPNIFLLSRM
jgi:hypothetical protein